MKKSLKGEDGKIRCEWCYSTPGLIEYHDKEWGYPVKDDQRLFEKICLEGFQSGLSWRTIFSKRENFRKAFKNFDFDRIALFKDSDVKKLLQDEGIVRHKGKIEAVIHNAKMAQEIVKEYGSLSAFIWSYETKSDALSKELKSRSWKFVGPTTVYAFMQAMGLINDHSSDCEFRTKAEMARQKFKTPMPKKR